MFLVSNPAQLVFCAYGTFLNKKDASTAFVCIEKTDNETCSSIEGCKWFHHPEGEVTNIWGKGSCHLKAFEEDAKGLGLLETIAADVKDLGFGPKELGVFRQQIPCLKNSFGDNAACRDTMVDGKKFGCVMCGGLPEAFGLQQASMPVQTLCMRSDQVCRMLQADMEDCLPTEPPTPSPTPDPAPPQPAAAKVPGGVAVSLLLAFGSAGLSLF